MKESVLNVLMYIFDKHMNKEKRIDINDNALFNELKLAGFPVLQIGKAFRWLYDLSEMTQLSSPVSDHSFRVFTEQECWLMNDECRNFIISLQNQGILTPTTREIVIHQTLELINEGVDINLIKWVTLMVLFNKPGCEEALTHMEFLVQSDAFDTVH